MVITSNVFNLNKSDYQNTPLFLGDSQGLVDTVNRQYPALWNLYKKMKSLDWDESEFDYSSCIRDFKICPKNTYDAMIKTLAWQWEADSIASRNIAPVLAPFISSTELWALWQRISDNEMIHALTYSEIVKGSFEDPNEILQEILSIKEAHARLDTVAELFDAVYNVSHEYALGGIDKDDTSVYDTIFLNVVALYVLERIQFINSFAITFGICETGAFNPIGKAVQKIAQDEFEVHCKTDRAVLDIELQTERGKSAFIRLKPVIVKAVIEVVESEIAWAKYILPEGQELVGLNQDLLIKWCLYNANELFTYFGIEHGYDIPTKNPLKYMENWLNISDTQVSPQEEKTGAYMLGQFINNDSDKIYELDI